MDKIKVYKMISGEEIIGEVFNVFGESVELKAPATIIMQQTEKGIGMGLMAYMPYAEGNIKLHKCAIASDGIPTIKMVNEYNRLFGSGIEIAPASALAGL